MKIARMMRSTHTGIGLLIGIQVVLWITGGFIMSALPLAKVRGEDRAAGGEPAPIPAEQVLMAPPAVAKAHGIESFEEARLVRWLDGPAYRLKHAGGWLLADAVTGVLLSPLDAATARRVAEADYTGPGAVTEVREVTRSSAEIRGLPLPVWRVAFDDGRSTTLYVSPDQGRVLARRNDMWRVFDFVWMLHIMDYSGRDDFNTPLLVIASAVGWVLAVTGIWLVVLWVLRKRKSRT
jgi:hypothetical protein